MDQSRVVEEIKSRIDIIDVISGYVQLKKSGQNWKGLCPFHSEKTPSFMVNPSRQIFHCFGCNSGGDVFAFLMKQENLSFGEALRMLAKQAGVSLPRSGARPVDHKEEQIRTALEAAAVYYEKQRATKKAAAYLSGRKISEESSSLFRIGYAPAGWHSIVAHLKTAGFPEETVRSAGLAVNGEHGLYDLFRDRIMFPITRSSGAVIAFGGRALGDAMPKYLNSPETPVFRKSETLFGLSQARGEIRSADTVMIVEGYLDVIVCHQYGFRSAVAPLGTALTAGHVARLRKLAGNALLVFDGDRAGLAAARRSLPILLAGDMRTKILLLPEGQDPDSLLCAEGAEALETLKGASRSVIEFMLATSGPDRTTAVRDTLALIAAASDPLAAEDMMLELSSRTRISESSIRAQFRALRKASTQERAATYNKPVCGSLPKEEEILLAAVIAFPDKLEEVSRRVPAAAFLDRAAGNLLTRLAAEQEKKGAQEGIAGASAAEKTLFTRLSVDPGFDPELVDQNIDDCIQTITRRTIDARLREAETKGDLALLSELLREKHNLMKGRGQ